MKLSICIATRGHADKINRLYRNILDTAEEPGEIEIVLGVDEDDPGSHHLDHDDLDIVTVLFPPKAGCGNYWNGCYSHSTGRYVMFMPDDVIIHTKGWDRAFYEAFAQFPDEIALVFPNDLIFGDRLCTMPVQSRKAIELIGNVISHTGYKCFRIDDHIHHIYDLLRVVGHNRIVYLKDIIFEHEDYVIENGVRVYNKARFPATEDALLYMDLLQERKEAAYNLAASIEPRYVNHYFDTLCRAYPIYQCFVRTT